MAYTAPALTPEWDPAQSGSWESMITAGVLDLGSRARFVVRSGVEYTDGLFVPVTGDIQMTLLNKDGGLNPRTNGTGIGHRGRNFSNTPVRIGVTHGASEYDLWSGFLRRRRRVWERGTTRSKVQASARGLLALLKGESVTVLGGNGIDVDEAMSQVLLACQGVESGDLSLSDSNQLLDFFFGNPTNVGRALMELLACEMGGMLYEGRDGKPTFKPRHSLLGYTLADSAKDTWGGSTGIEPTAIEDEDNDDEVLTSVTTRTNMYSAAAGANIIYYSGGYQFGGDTLYLDAGQAVGPRFIYPNQPGILSLLSTGTLSCEPYIDYRAAENADGTGADLTGDIEVTLFQDTVEVNQWRFWIRNTGVNPAIVGHFWIRADGVVLADGGQRFGAAGNTAPTGSNDATDGTVAWTDPTNIVSTNNSYATVMLTTSQRSNYLFAKLPMAITAQGNINVNGITFTIEAQRAGTSGTQAIKVAALKAGAIVGTPREFVVTDTERYITVGGSGDQWGTFWTAGDLADPNFGCAIWIEANVGDTYSVDHVYATAYYTQSLPYINRNEVHDRRLPLPDGARGGRSVSLDLRWIAEPNIARDWGEQVLRIGRYGAGIVRLRFKHTDDAIIAAMFSAEAGRLVRYSAKTGLGAIGDGYDDYFRVLNVEHVFQHGQLGETIITMMPAYNFRNLGKIAWDDFNRGDMSGLGVTPTGKTWTVSSGAMKIEDAHAMRSSSADAFAQFDIESPAHVVEARFTDLAANQYSIPAVMGRYSDTSNNWRLYYNYLGGDFGLIKRVAGVQTAKAVRTWGQFNTVDLRLIVRGDHVSAWGNGRLVFHGEDSALNTATRTGIFMEGITSTEEKCQGFYAQALGT